MEYAIFISISLTILTFYHFYKFNRTNYQKFEYYLISETNWTTRQLVTIWTFVLVIAFILLIIYLGGKLVNLFI